MAKSALSYDSVAVALSGDDIRELVNLLAQAKAEKS